MTNFSIQSDLHVNKGANFKISFGLFLTKLYTCTCTCKGKGIVCKKAKWPSG